MPKLRAYLYYIGLYLFSFVVLIPAILIHPLPYSWRRAYLIRWSLFNIWWVRVTCGLRYEVKGRENIPDGTAIVMSKHQSAYETVVLQQFLPAQTWVLKRELIWIPIFGWALAALDPVAIDRKAGKKALKQVIEQGIDRLNSGLWLVIFPEGTRVAPGTTGQYHIGGAMLAQKSGYPVVPIAHNSGEFWARRSIVKKPGTVTFSIGPAIDPRGKSAKAINAEVKAWIEQEMQVITTLN